MLLHVSILRSSSGSIHCSLLKLYVKRLITLLYLSVMRQHIKWIKWIQNARCNNKDKYSTFYLTRHFSTFFSRVRQWLEGINPVRTTFLWCTPSTISFLFSQVSKLSFRCTSSDPKIYVYAFLIPGMCFACFQTTYIQDVPLLGKGKACPNKLCKLWWRWHVGLSSLLWHN
jgi:hypothetical protein